MPEKTANITALHTEPVIGSRFTLPDLLVKKLVEEALAEDLGRLGDITSQAVIPETATATVLMHAREDGVVAGLEFAKQAFLALDPSLEITLLAKDGDSISQMSELMRVRGNARAILSAERVALNFAGKLSGIATKTAAFVAAAGAHKARICSTRKTTPGLRMAEKYAVRMGGGMNHRLGLDDAILIKDNHIAIAGGIHPALNAAREAAGHMVKIEIEVDTLAQLEEVLENGSANIVMLDNMPPEMLKTAVNMIGGRLLTEASGGVTLERVGAIAASGVDLISVGGLTHSARCLDIGLDFSAE
ncbi:MAG: carboxylating nicotinate-nucleotide diphosphorylase [Pseudomonadota bacterium]|nr:carboxylating nicotinate-nucleotide diphosphorylase [Pseudomonadota bacterium]QKK05901.1 MAG: carboxylating nicotinate-nucleotide diphosphorylase [Pseudomonadota bacterium]